MKLGTRLVLIFLVIVGALTLGAAVDDAIFRWHVCRTPFLRCDVLGRVIGPRPSPCDPLTALPWLRC